MKMKTRQKKVQGHKNISRGLVQQEKNQKQEINVS